MPSSFDPGQLGLSESSEAHRLLKANPDIQARVYSDGEYLTRENEDSKEMFLVLRGAYAVEQSSGVPGAPPAILATAFCELESPAIVGEMAYLGAQNRCASVRSAGSTYVLCLKPEHVDLVIDGYPGFTKVICQQFSRRLKETNKTIREFQSRFAIKSHERQLKPGEILFSKGEPAKNLFQIVMGAVRLDRDGVSTKVYAERLFRGFLEPGPFLRGKAQVATATIVDGEALVVSIDQKERLPLLRSYPEVAARVLGE